MRLNEISPELTRETLQHFEHDIESRYDLKSFSVFLVGISGWSQAIELNSLIVNQKKAGVGTAVMQELCDFADRYSVELRLTPGTKDSYHGTTSRTRLVRFYKRFGFRENRGRHRDFTTSAGMIRPAQSGGNRSI